MAKVPKVLGEYQSPKFSGDYQDSKGRDGSEKTVEQVLITPKGLAKLSQALCVTPALG